MLRRIFGNKNPNKVNDDGDEERKRTLYDKIILIKEEYDAIPGNTYIIEKSVRRFELIKQIVELTDLMFEHKSAGSSYGEIISDYEVAVRRIVARLQDILYSKKIDYPNEHKELQSTAHGLFHWRRFNYKRWWRDEKEPLQHDLDMIKVNELISEIEKVLA